MMSILEKGDFQQIDFNFMDAGIVALQKLAELQRKYKKGDNDNFLNELRDSMVGYYLGFKYINIDKHGFDCKVDSDIPIFLESKVASFSASSWGATFNDTNMEKAQAFKKKNVWLALSVWQYSSDLLFICYGQHEGIGEFLEKKVQSFLDGKGGVRSTQSISLNKLMKDYGFRILTISRTAQEIIQILTTKSQKFEKIVTLDRIDTLETFKSRNPIFHKSVS